MSDLVLQTALPGLPPPRRGKVRDVYDTGEHFLIVATDRISAFDVVLPNGIPGKGRVLTQISIHWFRQVADIVENHLVATDVEDFPAALRCCWLPSPASARASRSPTWPRTSRTTPPT